MGRGSYRNKHLGKALGRTLERRQLERRPNACSLANSPYGYLSSVVAIAPNNAWASVYESSTATMEHWNGTNWSIVSSSALTGVGIQALAADSANDVWAVGSTAVHYNGTTWTQVSFGAAAGILHTVAVISPTDVWAGGTGPYHGIPHGQVLHYNGTSWSVLASPDPKPNVSTTVSAIAAVSDGNLWATQGFDVEQWNGTSWTVFALPTGNGISALSSLADGTVVAVGHSGTGTLIMSNNTAMIGSKVAAAQVAKRRGIAG